MARANTLPHCIRNTTPVSPRNTASHSHEVRRLLGPIFQCQVGQLGSFGESCCKMHPSPDGRSMFFFGEGKPSAVPSKKALHTRSVWMTSDSACYLSHGPSLALVGHVCACAKTKPEAWHGFVNPAFMISNHFPRQNKNVYIIRPYRLYIGSFSADTYTFEWNLAIKPKGFFSRLSCGMVTSIIKSAQRNDGSDSRTNRLRPLLSNEIRKKNICLHNDYDLSWESRVFSNWH